MLLNLYLNMNQKIFIVIATVASIAAIGPFVKDIVFPQKTQVWHSFVKGKEIVANKTHQSFEACTVAAKNDYNNLNKSANEGKKFEVVCGLNCKENGFVSICETTQVVSLEPNVKQ